MSRCSAKTQTLNRGVVRMVDPNPKSSWLKGGTMLPNLCTYKCRELSQTKTL